MLFEPPKDIFLPEPFLRSVQVNFGVESILHVKFQKKKGPMGVIPSGKFLNLDEHR